MQRLLEPGVDEDLPKAPVVDGGEDPAELSFGEMEVARHSLCRN